MKKWKAYKIRKELIEEIDIIIDNKIKVIKYHDNEYDVELRTKTALYSSELKGLVKIVQKNNVWVYITKTEKAIIATIHD